MHRIRFTGLALLALGAALLFGAADASAGPLDAAQKALEKGDFEKAAGQFLKLCKKDGTARDAVLGLAAATYKGKLDDDLLFEAEQALGALLDKSEKDVDANLLLGEVYLLKASRQRDPQLLRGYYADARSRFSRALAERPKNQQAAVGVAKALYFQGDFIGAEDTLDAFLAKGPDEAGEAHFWRGEAIRIQAEDKYRQERQLSDEIKKMYEEAKGAYADSTAADPSSYDAWLRLAQSAHWSQDYATARSAYMQAVGTDASGTKVEALKGLASLHAHEPEKYSETLGELAKDNPKHEQVLLYAIADHFGRERDDEAKPLIDKFVKVAKNPSAGHFYAGQIAERAGDHPAAIAAYKKSLATQPDYNDPAWAWSQLLISAKDLPQKVGSWGMAEVTQLIEDYQPLFQAAPKNVWPRNSLGFALREFYVAHAQRGEGNTWESVLKESIKAYEAAAKIIGEYDPGFATSLSFPLRYGYAQVVSDTGLMFQFYPATKDWKKAEMYYLRALEWSDHGYFDAWNNLRQMYAAEQRWDDLYDLASLCADGLVREDRSEHTEGRAQARGVMKQLESSGKVSGN